MSQGCRFQEREEYLREGPPWFLSESRDCRVTMDGDSVASSCHRGVEDLLQVRDPWSLYAASKPRERMGVVPSTSCGVAPPTTFDLNAEVYVPRPPFCADGDSTWQHLAIARQHTLAFLTRHFFFRAGERLCCRYHCKWCLCSCPDHWQQSILQG